MKTSRPKPLPLKMLECLITHAFAAAGTTLSAMGCAGTDDGVAMMAVSGAT
jgi:hypothetical protein